MKMVLIGFALAAVSASAGAQTAHEVRGYTKADGTYVAPHYQSNPDATRLNNYSTQGNVNPYTGQSGTVDPYAPKSAPKVAPWGRWTNVVDPDGRVVQLNETPQKEK